jgi:predicted regulator of Ras-like GTPase activity (Roadblock/LC7/MglB family)
MATLPQLNEEDVHKLDATLQEFLTQADATVAMVTDKGGFLITHQGKAGDLDLTTVGALASGAFMASQSIAGLVNEANFNHTLLQGEQTCLCTLNVDEHCLLVVIFPAKTGVGVVKYYALAVLGKLAGHLAAARRRDPEGGLDLSEMNLADPGEFFKKKPA